jgi:ribose-phosphate pyrophosphokinase
LFATPVIDGIVVSNTVPPFRVVPEVAPPRLTVLDASEAIARAIAACHDAS